jgi:hypothetical protein
MHRERGGGERRHKGFTDTTTVARQRDAAEVVASGGFQQPNGVDSKNWPAKKRRKFQGPTLSYIGWVFLQAAGIDHRL